MRARSTGAILDWPKAPDDQPPVILGGELDMTHPAEAERGVYLPVQVYPMFETAIRAAAGPPPTSTWSPSASSGPLQRGRRRQPVRLDPRGQDGGGDPHDVGGNRLVGLPYRKYMNSNNDVDMAAAVIICSAEAARRLGVAEDRWVFPHAGTDCHEHAYVSNRDTFARTPAIEIGGGRALELAGIGIDDVAIVDLYSCFPAAVQLGAQSLGLSTRPPADPHRRAPFAGGPWNNYVMHAIATVVGDLREQPGESGWCGPTAATSPSTPSACTPPSRRPTGSATTTRRPRSTPCRAASSPRRRRRRPGDDRGLHRDARPRRHAGAGHRDLPARRRPPGVGPVGRRRRRPRALGDGEWVGRPCRASTPPATLRACRSSGRATRAVPILLDCDPGHDDAVAIVVAARHAELLGITTVAGNAPLDRTTHNALVVRDLLGVDVPGPLRRGPSARRRAAHRAGGPRRERARRRRPARRRRARSTAPTPSGSSSTPAGASRASGSSPSVR